MSLVRVEEIHLADEPVSSIFTIRGEDHESIKGRITLLETSHKHEFVLRSGKIQTRIIAGDISLELWDSHIEKYVKPSSWQLLWKKTAIKEFPKHAKLFSRRMEEDHVDLLNVIDIPIARPVEGKSDDNMFSNYTFPCMLSALREDETYLLMKSIIPPPDESDSKKRKVNNTS